MVLAAGITTLGAGAIFAWWAYTKSRRSVRKNVRRHRRTGS